MDADLEPVYTKVIHAIRPEDVFRELHMVLPERLLGEHLKVEVERIREILSPDRYSDFDDVAAARYARNAFEVLYQRALEKASQGLYALDGFSLNVFRSSGTQIVVDGVTYAIGTKVHTTEHADLYEATFACDGGTAKALVRIAHSSAQNSFIYNEIRILNLLHAKVADKELGYWRYLPYVFGRFTAENRVGIIYRWFEGVTATEIRLNKLHRNGLDQRHVIWIFDRIINLLGYAHSQGVIHGRIEPDRIRIRPSNHNAMLTGWGQAVYKPATTGELLAPGAGNAFLAPEALTTGEVGPWTDIYSLGKSMIWLLGGDPQTNQMPTTVEPKVQRFLQNIVRNNPRARPNDAWQLYKAQNALKDSIWERRFLPLYLAC